MLYSLVKSNIVLSRWKNYDMDGAKHEIDGVNNEINRANVV